MTNTIKKILLTFTTVFIFTNNVNATTCELNDSNGFCLVTDDNAHVEIDGRNYFGENLETGVHPGFTYFKVSNNNDVLYCSNGTLSTSGLTDSLEPIDQACTEKTINKNSIIYSYEYGYGKYSKTGEYNYNSDYLTGEYIEDYYITQNAVWNFSPPTEEYLLEFWNNGWFKNYDFVAKTFYGIKDETITKISNLINDATTATNANPSLTLTASNTSMNVSSDGKYYISDEITIAGKYLNKAITISIEGAPGAFITTDKNATSGITSLSNEISPSYKTTAYIKVPVESITAEKTSIKLYIKSESAFNDGSKIIECSPRKNTPENRLQPMIKYIPNYIELKDEITLTTQKFPVEISKKDANGNLLKGATLAVKKDSTIIATWTTDASNNTILLAPGTYTLEETKVPDGYISKNISITFVVDESGLLYVDNNVTNEIIVTNEPIIIKISKKSIIGDNELAGATLRITDKEGNIAKDINGNKLEWISTGTAKSFHVVSGTYVLEEVNAPEGYELSDKKIEFIVNIDGTITIKEGLLIKKDKILEDNLIIFENTPEPEQVPTGNTVLYISITLGVIALGVVSYIILRKSKK